MKKFLTATLIATLILGATPAEAAWRTNECRFRTLDGKRGWSIEEVKQTIRCASVRFGISTEMAMLVAEHESGFRADTGYGTHCGIFQHVRTYFDERLAGAAARWPRYRWFGKRCENARSNIFAAFHLVKSSGGWEAGWCRWTAYC